MRQQLASFLSLFGSFSTLICCALPSVLVALGAGAVVASLVSALPWLMWVSRHKTWFFLVAGLLLAVNAILIYRPHGTLACVVGGGTACEAAKRWNTLVLWVSVALYGFGVFMTYMALPLRRWLAP